jgi:hypothetical protein
MFGRNGDSSMPGSPVLDRFIPCPDARERFETIVKAPAPAVLDVARTIDLQSLPPEAFAAYVEPDQVKIAWTLEVEWLGPARTRFIHETRAVATDDEARRRFLRYWRWARFGIVTIRYLMMLAVRRLAEARWAEAGHAS